MWTGTIGGEEGGGDQNWKWRNHRDCVDSTAGGETLQGYRVQRSSQETPRSGRRQVGRVLLVRYASSQHDHCGHHPGLQETTMEQLVKQISNWGNLIYKDDIQVRPVFSHLHHMDLSLQVPTYIRHNMKKLRQMRESTRNITNWKW